MSRASCLLFVYLLFANIVHAQQSKIDSTITILRPIFAPIPIDKGFSAVAKFVDDYCELDSTTEKGQRVFRVKDIAPFEFTIPNYHLQQVKFLFSRTYIDDSTTNTTDSIIGYSLRLYAGKQKHKKAIRKFFKLLEKQLNPFLFQIYNFSPYRTHFANVITFQPEPSPSHFIFKGVYSIGRIKGEQVVYLHLNIRNKYRYDDRLLKVLGYDAE